MASTHKEVISFCRTAWQFAMLSCFFSAVQWFGDRWED